LEVSDRDSECSEDNFAEKNKADGDAQASEDSNKSLFFAFLWWGARAEPDKKCNETNGVNRDEYWNESEEKFVGEIAHLDLTSRFYTIHVAHSTFMRFRSSFLLVLGLALGARAENLKSIDSYSDAVAKANARLTIPDWPETPEAVETSAKEAIKRGNAALDAIGRLDRKKVTFQNTVVALDDLAYEANNVGNKATIIKQANTDPKMRAAAEKAVKTMNDWFVGIDYREDVYKSIKAFAETNPQLTGEDKKLLDETMRDYRRAGLALSPEKRKEVEQLRKQLAKLGTDFDTNIANAKRPVVFTKAELEGMPEDFLSKPGIKTGDDAYTVLANVTWQFNAVEENAKSEATRKRLYIARETLAMEKNVPLLNQMLTLRNKIALRLGYKSWDDFQTEPRMAKTGAAAQKYIDDLVAGIEPKFAAELSELQKMKQLDAQPSEGGAFAAPRINVWDWRYYQNQLKKQKFAVDAEALRNFFPFQKVLDGMFAIYQRIFGLKFEQIAVPYKWIDDLQLWAVSDAASGEPLGLFYLDMFPRDGKYNHFAEFEIIGGKLLPDGKYQRPTVTLLCNFPPATADKPSLLSHSEVETLFHEFGHVLHTITTRAKYGRFAGTHVPTDFVESPSQMLQNWVWDKNVLDSFAADYREPSKKIPGDTIQKMKDAKLATAGVFYRRQFAFASLDLALHGPHPENAPYDCVAISNPILEKVFLPIDPSTTFVSYFGHLNGYDAGYYGYAWADAIAADMATVFESAPEGYFDQQAGKRLRNEIYAMGDSRDVNESIEKFLGRKQSVQPFLKKIGIGEASASAASP
jgi:Zn-dependent oligopeptidase